MYEDIRCNEPKPMCKLVAPVVFRVKSNPPKLRVRACNLDVKIGFLETPTADRALLRVWVKTI